MSSSDSAKKWALCIGIDRYPLLTGRDLRGCVNDARQIAEMLTDRFQFPKDQVSLLLNEEATRDAILSAMDALVGKAGKDDVVVLHFSGHGSQMTDREGDEEDGMDETILPYDASRKPSHENRDITDDEIYAWLLRFEEITPNVTLIFDCCHSGTIVREGPGAEHLPVEVRWVEPDDRPLDELPPSPFAEGYPWPRDIGPSGWLPVGERFTLLAGCSSGERSYEIQFRSSENLGSNGAFTYYLLDALRNAPKDVTYRDVFERAAYQVTGYREAQHPQLEGAKDRELFGPRRLKPMHFVPVVARSGGRLTLGAGASQGVVERSIWTVYPSSTKTQEGVETLGRVEILRVEAATSEARLLGETRPEAIAPGARAVLESKLPDGLLVTVAVQAGPGHEDEVRCLSQTIEGSRFLAPAREGAVADVTIHLVPPRSGEVQRDGLPAIGQWREPVWAPVGLDGALWMRPCGVDEVDSAGRVVENLERHARYEYALSLSNPASELEGSVDLTFLRRFGGEWVPAHPGPGGEVTFQERERLALKITNQSERPLYVHVLDFGITGNISLIYPVYAGARKALLPEHSIEIGTRLGEEIDPYIPTGFPYDREEGASPVRAREIVKVFVTTHEADFRPLFQDGMRHAADGILEMEEGSLEHQIAYAVTDPSAMPRDFRERGPAPDWVAFECEIYVERWE